MDAQQKVSVAVRTRVKVEALGERYEAECVKKLDDTSLIIQQVEFGEKPKNCTLLKMIESILTIHVL